MRYIRASLFTLFFVSASVLCVSCTEFESPSENGKIKGQKITFTLPKYELPEMNEAQENEAFLPEISRWKIEVRSASYFGVSYAEEDRTAGNGTASNREVNLFIPDEMIVSVKATPILKSRAPSIPREETSNQQQKEEADFSFFKPAGTIFPYGEELTFLQGFSAELLSEFFVHSKIEGNSADCTERYASCFNWKKLMTEMERLSRESEESDSFYNPWLLDKSEILREFESGNFSVSYLKMKKLHSFSRDDKAFEKLPSDEFLISTYFPENRHLFSEGKFWASLKQEKIFLLGQSERKLSFYAESATKSNVVY